MDWIGTAQDALAAADLDAWLLYDFRGSNPWAARVLAPLLDGGIASRRVFLLVPRSAPPVLLVHAIERGSVPPLPFEVRSYGSRGALAEQLGRLVAEAAAAPGASGVPPRIAMEYSPEGDNPYVGTVDAGTVEWVRSLGADVRSSGDVTQAFCRWTPAQVDRHLEAAEAVLAAKDHAFAFMGERLALGATVRESEVQRLLARYFEERGLVFDHPANVSFGAHAGDPHYVVRPGADAELEAGHVVLVDLWARLDEEGAPYADVTWMGVCGEAAPRVEAAFEAVRDARDAALRALQEAFADERYPEGRAIDRVARAVLEERGFGDAFTHRTGHSLGHRTTHGEAAHLDDFETSERRRLLPGVGVTIEPGVYFDDFGVRSEIDVLLEEGSAVATTELQAELERLPAPRGA